MPLDFAQSAHQFETEVFPAEFEEIARRRGTLGLPPSPGPSRPSASHGFMGLALSGGGIRSACVGLGALQTLAEHGVLEQIDYVSTVSGGGLIGSTLSAALNTPGASTVQDRWPLGADTGKPERPLVRYLRNHNRYLAPGGLLDTVRLPAMVLRGLLDNFALIVPLLVVAVQATEFLFVFLYRLGLDRVRLLPLAGCALFVLMSLVQPAMYRLFPRRYDWARRNQYEQIIAASLLACIVALMFFPLFMLSQQAMDLGWDDVMSFIARHPSRLWLATGALAIALTSAARKMGSPTIGGKLSMLLLGIVGPGLVFAAYLILALYQVDSPRLDPGIVGQLNGGVVTPAIQQVFADKHVSVSAGAPIERAERNGYRWWRVDDAGQELITEWNGKVRLINTLLWDGNGDLAIVLAGVGALLFAMLFANQNVTSQHGFFRDRLSRAFLVSFDGRAVQPRDDLKLSALNPPGSVAPYHLVNTTLNLQGVIDPELGGRDADFLVLSRHFCGGPSTGYCRTTDLERADPHLTLGTAMAVSGAGLAPNSGTGTIKPLVFLTALFDLRLDYWLPNPAKIRRGSRRFWQIVGPQYLLKEALGQLDARGAFVNISDGGHIENLGVYELLRRRCAWILAIDASEDPAMTCDCLTTVIRYARIDLGIDIRVNLDALQPNASGLCAAHAVVAEVDYGSGERGTLIYLKSSLTGDEPEPVRAFKRTNPAFPHDSSANQFFTEAQFEAYRALGAHMAASVMEQTADALRRQLNASAITADSPRVTAGADNPRVTAGA